MQDAQVRRGDHVIDVGAGDGRLTATLAAHAGHVTAVELDPRLARRLRQRFANHSRVSVVEADLHEFTWPQQPFRVVANPPFAATNFLLRELLGPTGRQVTALDLVVQHGAALKRTRQTGHALNISWLPWWTLRIGRRLPATAFRPPPATDAAVLVARQRDPPLLPPAQAEAFAAFVQEGFRRGVNQRSPVSLWAAQFQGEQAHRHR